MRAPGLAINRSPLPLPGGLDPDEGFRRQRLQDPVQGAAIRLIAERLADLAAREPLGQPLERRADVIIHLGSAPAPGRLRRRSRRGSRGRWGSYRGKSHRSHAALEHPDQIEGPDLGLIGRLHQLDAGAALLFEAELALFVFIAGHGVHD